VGTVASHLPGDEETLTATAFIQEDTINTATAVGDGPGGSVCSADSNPVIVTVAPLPPCSVSINFKEVRDDKVKYTLTNNSGVSRATIDNLRLDFPSDLGLIKEVKLHGAIFKSRDSSTFPAGVPSGVTIGPSDWTESDVSKRTLAAGTHKDVEIKFTDRKPGYSSNDFTLVINFAEGCGVVTTTVPSEITSEPVSEQVGGVLVQFKQ
jgi:hypothetical protein